MGKSITSGEASGIDKPGKGTGSIAAGDLPVTPMMKQYLEIKARCPDSILFFRLGDFYEMFFDDAKTVSRELELVLTGKDCGMAERAPMCGIPYHASLSYISRLIAKGYKISVCEQIEDPALAKGLVKRDIIRIITPGTLTDSAAIGEKRNNYLLSICVSGRKAGCAYADVSTGEMYARMGSADERDLRGVIAAVAPAEIITNAEDMQKWLLSFSGNSLLSDDSKQKMSSDADNPGYGFGVIPTENGWSHNGVFTSYTAFDYVDPKAGSCVFAVTNNQAALRGSISEMCLRMMTELL